MTFVGFCRFLSHKSVSKAMYYCVMELNSFCNTYIDAEYHRLKTVLKDMPRFSTGVHSGIQVIRTYSGSGSNIVRTETRITGRNIDTVEQQYSYYLECQKAFEQFRAELYKRKIPISDQFKFIRDPSPFNVEAWKNFKACSNPNEINTNYIDAYGNNVRSRGEMLVANALKELGLEAKYEPLLTLKGGKKRSPDYVFPVRIIDRCFFIEFYGKCDNEGYVDYNYGKIDEYIRSGILPNRDLILICGTENWLPNQDEIIRIISSFINNAVLRTYNRNS